MIPVNQTILTVPGGDCLRACVASIFEKPIEEVPNFGALDDWYRDDDGKWVSTTDNLWWKGLADYVHQLGGWSVIELAHNEGDHVFGMLPIVDVAAIATVKSPICRVPLRNGGREGHWDPDRDHYHCVVADLRTGDVLHDPHPTPKGKVKFLSDDITESWMLFVKPLKTKTLKE